jgi:DNA-binding transcriptional regulator YdaS (Cro superfamily)
MLEMLPMTDKPEALQRAIKKAGGQAEFARRIGVTTQAVSQWDEVPPLRVLTVERVSGVPRSELRPDLYPAEDEARA